MTLILLLWVFFLTLCSIIFLLKAKDYTGISDYKSLARLCFGQVGAFITDICIFINNFGICLGYLIIFSDCFYEFLNKGFDVSREEIWGHRWLHIIAGAALITPFLYAKSTKLLAFASGLSIFSIILFILITAIDFTRSVTVQSLNNINIFLDF